MTLLLDYATATTPPETSANGVSGAYDDIYSFVVRNVDVDDDLSDFDKPQDVAAHLQTLQGQGVDLLRVLVEEFTLADNSEDMEWDSAENGAIWLDEYLANTQPSGAFRTLLTGIEITGNPTFEQFQAEFEATWYSEMACNWSRGDLLLYGEAKFGEAYAQVVDPTRFNPKTLANNMWVCRAFKPDERVPNVSFSDHAECASLEGEQRAFAMGKLASREWVRKDVRKWKRELSNEPQPPKTKTVTVNPVNYYSDGKRLIVTFDCADVPSNVISWHVKVAA